MSVYDYIYNKLINDEDLVNLLGSFEGAPSIIKGRLNSSIKKENSPLINIGEPINSNNVSGLNDNSLQEVRQIKILISDIHDINLMDDICKKIFNVLYEQDKDDVVHFVIPSGWTTYPTDDALLGRVINLTINFDTES